jgi:N-acyl-D-aspartate/D-glutamate deacylase
MPYDLIVKNGTLIDGTGAPRRIVDLAISDGRVARIGDLEHATADRVIDATGQIVAPGVIDVHTHYDASINWDPYATSSSWHGTTTVVAANCGFGYAPVHAQDRERIMLMMKNTEQIPIATQRLAMNWSWETFPQWMDYLRSLPKGASTSDARERAHHRGAGHKSSTRSQRACSRGTRRWDGRPDSAADTGGCTAWQASRRDPDRVSVNGRASKTRA